jgi:membrane protease YdiL (CAAX protease family)
MSVFLLFLAYLLTFLGIASLVVPMLQPWAFDPVGLRPESSLYRFAMLAAALSLPLFLRYLALNSWRAAGFTLPRSEAWRMLRTGLLVGITIMVALIGTQWLIGVHHFAVPANRWTAYDGVRTVVSGLLSGLAVGLIEETFFRGLMHTGMRRSLGFWPTALLTALLYAALHFMKPAPLAGATFDIAHALQMIGAGVTRIGDFAPVADSFSTLFMAGVFLSMVREKTGSILCAIGIHAGWVMTIKLGKYLTDPTIVDGQASIWVGQYDHITGWLATLWLGLITTGFWHRSRQPSGLGSPSKPTASGTERG